MNNSGGGIAPFKDNAFIYPMTLTREHKESIHAACLEKVRQQIADAQAMITDAEDAIRNDTKSSAGDKYETGREMATQQKVKAAGRLAEANGLLAELNKIDPEREKNEIGVGALVEMSNGIFYIAVGMGKIEIPDFTCFAISLASPIGKVLGGAKAGGQVTFRGQNIDVKQVL